MINMFNLSQEPDNIEKAKEYLSSRKISYFEGAGFIDFYESYSNSLVIPIYSPNGKTLIGLDVKDIESGEYSKIVIDKNYIQVYFDNYKPDAKTLLVTEGIINAKSVTQLLPDLPSASLLTAGFSSKHMHLVAACGIDHHVIAFDNDKAGVSASNRYLEFFKEFYPKVTVSVLDIPFNDLNEYRCKTNPRVFLQSITSQFEGNLQ